MNSRCVSLVLASGQGSRFDGIKQLAEIEGQSMIVRVAMQQADLAHSVVIVLGAHADAIAKHLSGEEAHVVVNKNWEQGMSSSIACGVEYISHSMPETEFILITLADQPFISSGKFQALMDSAMMHPDSIVASAYANTIGVPAVFPKIYWDELQALDGDKGARFLIRNSPSLITVDIPEAARDIDTADDLDRS